MVQLKEVLHYYLGQKCRLDMDLSGKTYTIEAIGNNGTVFIDTKLENKWKDISRITPILRPIDSLTEDERQKYDSFCMLRTDGVHTVMVHVDTPVSFLYLLSIGIDLFNLIETNQAIKASPL